MSSSHGEKLISLLFIPRRLHVTRQLLGHTVYFKSCVGFCRFYQRNLLQVSTSNTKEGKKCVLVFTEAHRSTRCIWSKKKVRCNMQIGNMSVPQAAFSSLRTLFGDLCTSERFPHYSWNR